MDDFRLKLLGEELTSIKCAKDLGVTLDSHLTYNNHMQATVSSCMFRLGQINRVKHCFNRHTLTIIINALVFSKLFYCSTVWSSTSEANLDKIQSIQRSCDTNFERTSMAASSRIFVVPSCRYGIQVRDRKCTWVYSKKVPETIARIIPADKKFRYDEHSTVSNSKWSTNISVQSDIIVEFVVTR